MKEQLEKVKQDGALAALAAAKETVDLGKHPGKYLGKKGELTALLKQMGKLSAEECPIIGQLVNEIREKLTNEIESQRKTEEASWKPRCRQRQWTSPSLAASRSWGTSTPCTLPWTRLKTSS